MYLVLLLPFLVYLPFLYYQGRFHFDTGPVASLLIGLTTIGMMFVSIGLFFSAQTRNQIIAAIWTFVVLFLVVVLTLLVYNYAAERQAVWAEGVRFVALLYQVQEFGAGKLDLQVPDAPPVGDGVHAVPDGQDPGDPAGGVNRAGRRDDTMADDRCEKAVVPRPGSFGFPVDRPPVTRTFMQFVMIDPRLRDARTRAGRDMSNSAVNVPVAMTEVWVGALGPGGVPGDLLGAPRRAGGPGGPAEEDEERPARGLPRPGRRGRDASACC